jgi:hypothetical protein
MTKATVDRIEGEFAVMLLNEDDSVQFHLPLRIFPSLHEGDIIDITFTRDDIATGDAKKKVSDLIEKLKNKNK